MDKISCIYKIVNTVNGKSYIGSTVDFDKRVNTHKNELKRNNHINPYLQNSYNKYGDVFRYIIFRYCDAKDLHKLEKHYIQKYNPEYNIGGVGGGDSLKNHPNRKNILRKMSKDRMGCLNSNWRGGSSYYNCEKCNIRKRNYHGGKTTKLCKPCFRSRNRTNR